MGELVRGFDSLLSYITKEIVVVLRIPDPISPTGISRFFSARNSAESKNNESNRNNLRLRSNGNRVFPLLIRGVE